MSMIDEEHSVFEKIRGLVPWDLVMVVMAAVMYTSIAAVLPTWVSVGGVMLLLISMFLRSRLNQGWYLIFLCCGAGCIILLTFTPEYQSSELSGFGPFIVSMVCVEAAWVWSEEEMFLYETAPTKCEQFCLDAMGRIMNLLLQAPRLLVLVFLVNIIGTHYHLLRH